MLATRACTSLSLRATARKTATVRGLAIGDKLSDKVSRVLWFGYVSRANKLVLELRE